MTIRPDRRDPEVLPSAAWQLRLTDAAWPILCCPACASEVTHVDRVYISARYEDAIPTDEIRVHARSGRIQTRCTTPAPVAPSGEGRRHRISLIGWCELCGSDWALVFTQHKGATLVELTPTEAMDHWEMM